MSLNDDARLREVGDVADESASQAPSGSRQRFFPFLRGRGGWLAE